MAVIVNVAGVIVKLAGGGQVIGVAREQCRDDVASHVGGSRGSQRGERIARHGGVRQGRRDALEARGRRDGLRPNQGRGRDRRAGIGAARGGAGPPRSSAAPRTRRSPRSCSAGPDQQVAGGPEDDEAPYGVPGDAVDVVTWGVEGQGLRARGVLDRVAPRVGVVRREGVHEQLVRPVLGVVERGREVVLRRRIVERRVGEWNAPASTV